MTCSSVICTVKSYLNNFQAQFANVVATAADYDSDRETEQNRVKQILQDLDESFSKDEGKITTHLFKTIITHSDNSALLLFA